MDYRERIEALIKNTDEGLQRVEEGETITMSGKDYLINQRRLLSYILDDKNWQRIPLEAVPVIKQRSKGGR